MVDLTRCEFDYVEGTWSSGKDRDPATLKYALNLIEPTDRYFVLMPCEDSRFNLTELKAFRQFIDNVIQRMTLDTHSD